MSNSFGNQNAGWKQPPAASRGTSTPFAQNSGAPWPYIPELESLDRRFPTADHSNIKMEPQSPSRIATPPHNIAVEPFSQVTQAIFDNSVAKLERRVELALSILSKLRKPLNDAKDNMDAARFLKSIDTLKGQTQSAHTLIGVVGNTGSGKSSVINALLDEEMLVPTNCMRACTAVITELSYNSSDNPSELYRAEIEFISLRDWIIELSAIYEDLIDSKGDVSKDCANTETDAGIGWAKVKAVYPQHTPEMLRNTNADALANKPEVYNTLGATKKISESSCEVFYEKLRKYIDSQEKNTGNKGRKRKTDEGKAMEFWPLVKAVRIYTKADALSTGAIIVDLPGVHDSNAARAAVADKYIEKCTGLWIVAPIQRAVDDKTAQNLLGQSFKLQLKYDGTYSKVTFICSKTDDISITEAVSSLGLEETVERCQTDICRVESELAEKAASHQALQQQDSETQNRLNDVLSSYDTWHELSHQQADGKMVFAPSQSTKKRRFPAGQTSSRKRPDRGLFNLNEDSSSSESDEENSTTTEEAAETSDSNREPLTKEQIRSELDRQRSEKDQLTENLETIRKESKTIYRAIKSQKKEMLQLEARLKSICIQERNKYSRDAIRLDFARGVKEMDQDAAMQENDELFDPEQDVRDYEEVAASLPVFCISSRAFQKASGRLRKDDKIQGFENLEETEVPQLQLHTKQLTEAGRASNCKKFLEDFIHILNSLNLWSQDHGAEIKLTDGEKKVEVAKLHDNITILGNALNQAAISTVKECRKILAGHLYDKFESSIESAANAAATTAQGWGLARESGGLPFQTYKATCRREGNFSGKLGHKDFNEELIQPLKESLANPWERVFARRIPRVLDKFPDISQILLEKFHREVKGRIGAKTTFASINMLMIQLRLHCVSISAVIRTFRAKITSMQREASRELTPAIARTMAHAYQVCKQESGPGSFARMKDAMIQHVMASRYAMFHEATNSVQDKLDGICEEMEHELLASINTIITEMTSEYSHVVIGTDLAKVSRAAREEISEILGETDELFMIQSFNNDRMVDVNDNSARWEEARLDHDAPGQ